MKLPRRKFLHLAAGAAALPVVSRIASAQTYPSRPVRWIVGYPPAGATDITARLMGQWLSERLNQPFVIENRPGASGNIGTEVVVNAPPTAIRSSWSTRGTQSTRRFTKSSNTILSATSRQSPASSASSSPMPRPIRANSTWRRPATVLRNMSPVSCSR